MISAVLAGLAGGLYGYVRLSFWQVSSVFSPSWTFDALLSVVVGGAGTLFGPVIGSVFLVVLSEVFANTLGQAHLIIFGFLFILVVLFLPQGLMGGADLLRRGKMPSRPEEGERLRGQRIGGRRSLEPGS